MNEQIQKLAKEAGFYVVDNKIHTPTTSEDITACQTKFAELIVRECARTCDTSRYTFGTIFSKIIKHHFGVDNAE